MTRRAGIPVVALTALAMKGDEARIRAAGCEYGYIAKPLAYQDFLSVIAARLVTTRCALEGPAQPRDPAPRDHRRTVTQADRPPNRASRALRM